MISFDKKSWVLGSEHTEFPIQNIPFGIYSTASKSPRIGTAIGNKVLDIHQLINYLARCHCLYLGNLQRFSILFLEDIYPNGQEYYPNQNRDIL